MEQEENNKSLLYSNTMQSSLKPKGSNTARVVVLLLVLCVFVFGGIAVYVWQLTSKTNPDTSETKTRQAELEALYAQEALPASPEGRDPLNYGLERVATSSEIRGHLVFSGVPLGSKELTRVYTLDLGNASATPVRLLPEKYRINGFAEFFDSSAASDFFVNTLDEKRSSTSTDTDGTRIQRYDIETGTLHTYESLAGAYEQQIALSPAKDIVAFKRLIVPFKSYTDLVPINNWEVVLSDINTDTVIKRISGASQPKWSSDGSLLLVLKTDGLYTYEIKTGLEIKVVDTENEGQILSTSMIDVSPDGKYLIWTTAKAGVIAVNEIVSWNPFVLHEIGRINESGTEYYWPQFSPDSTHYLVQAIDGVKEGESDRSNPRFEIRPVDSRSVVRTIPIVDFDFNAYFTDTWIEEVPVVSKEESL